MIAITFDKLFTAVCSYKWTIMVLSKEVEDQIAENNFLIKFSTFRRPAPLSGVKQQVCET